MNHTFWSSPGRKTLIREHGLAGQACLIHLWHLTGLINAADGDLSGHTDAEIENAVDWNGEPGALIPALAKCGFVVGNEGERMVVGGHWYWLSSADHMQPAKEWAYKTIENCEDSLEN